MSLQEREVVQIDVVDLFLIETEHLQKDFFDLVELEQLVLVCVVFEKDPTQLLHDYPNESVPGTQVLQR